MLNVTTNNWRLTYDRNMKHGIYIGGFIIEDLKSGQKRGTIIRPDTSTTVSLYEFEHELATLFYNGNDLRGY